jgi:hypothetical protein
MTVIRRVAASTAALSCAVYAFDRTVLSRVDQLVEAA